MFSWECTIFLKQQKQPPKVFRKKVFLKISLYSQENTCVGAYLVSLESTLLKKDSNTDIFLWILRNLQDHLFYRTFANYCILKADSRVGWPNNLLNVLELFSP